MRPVLVSGALANKYLNGGEAWVRLSWLLGLRRLGFPAYFVEQIDRASCVDESGRVVGFDACANRRYFESVMDQFGLSDSAALVYEDDERTAGLSYEELREVAEAAVLLLNISGHLQLEALLRPIPCKVYIDVDPGFTQFWAASGQAGPHFEEHDFYFTIGENIGKSFCRIPTNGVAWRPTRPPVVLSEWPLASDGDSGRFTTVATWRGPYGRIEHGGTTFGLKVHEFRKFIDLPARVPQTLELALDIHPGDEKDLDALLKHGWRVVDARTAVPDPASFRSYVQASGGEFSVAQGIYVETQSGWFSDRSVRYLASGKPALVQDTGFSRNYPATEGLFAFQSREDAMAGADRIARDYDFHRAQARVLAETYFDSDKVLGQLLEEVGVGP